MVVGVLGWNRYLAGRLSLWRSPPSEAPRRPAEVLCHVQTYLTDTACSRRGAVEVG